MIRRQLVVLLAFLLIASGLGYSLVQLFALRMGAGGDAFPEYSTLRADPLGAEALFDSLNSVPGLTASRNFLPLTKLQTSGPVALLYLGISRWAQWEDEELPRFETLVAGGSRAVFAFQPEDATDPAEERADESLRAALGKKREAEAGKEKPKMEKLMSGDGTPFAEVAQKWGFQFEGTRRGRRETPPPPAAALGQADAYGLEAMLPWHTELHFTNVQAPWKTLYGVNGKPALIERPWGLGSIVVCADSYFLSNEGLRDPARPTQLIAALFGAHRTIVFDEEHLGVSEHSNIASLARKYRLHGFLAGLGLIAALFIWQNIVRFVPPQEDELAAAALVTGRGSSEGFLALLRRSVPSSQLLATCLAEWRRTFTGDPRVAERLTATLPANPQKAPEIVATFHSMAKSVSSEQSAST